MEMPPIKYARSGDVNIAYQVTGKRGAVDLVSAPGTMSHLALSWDEPRTVQMIERMSRFARFIRFDKRGTGMSDRVTDAATLEERADDIRAVMDASGSDQAVVLGGSEGGSMACMFAAMHPARTRALIVWGCQARFVRAPDYPWGVTAELYEKRIADLARDWPSREYVRTWGAGVGPEADDSVVDAILHRMQMAASPAAVVALERMNGAGDIRDILPAIRVPTLVMARDGDPITDREAVRDMARRISGARVMLFPGKTHYMGAPWIGIDPEPVYAAIEEFVTGSPPALPESGFSPRSHSSMSCARRSARRSWEIARGVNSSTCITAPCATSCQPIMERRSIRLGTDYSRRSRDPRVRSNACERSRARIESSG
jgi:pimeloyl-ACP methyl ester carboxylesterase